MSYNLKDLKELAFKLFYINRQVFNKYLKMLEKARSLLEYKTYSYIKYIGFL